MKLAERFELLRDPLGEKKTPELPDTRHFWFLKRPGQSHVANTTTMLVTIAEISQEAEVEETTAVRWLWRGDV